MEKCAKTCVVIFLLFLLWMKESQCDEDTFSYLQDNLERCKKESTCSDWCGSGDTCQKLPKLPKLPVVFVVCGMDQTSEVNITNNLVKDGEVTNQRIFATFNNRTNDECEAFAVSYNNSTRDFTIETTAPEGRTVKPVEEGFNVSRRVTVDFNEGNCFKNCTLGETTSKI